MRLSHIEVSDLQQPVRDGVDDECCFQRAVDRPPVDRMDVPVQQHFRSHPHDEPVKRGEALMGVIAGVTNAQRWGVGDDEVDAVAEPSPQPYTRLQPQGPPAHLALRVLVGTLLVSERPAEAGDVQVKGGKSQSESGGSFVDMVQAAENRPRDHLPVDLATARHRSLQCQRSMGAILVVVAHELGQHRSDMPFAQRRDVIQALAA